MDWLKSLGVVLELGAAGFIVARAWWSGRVFKQGRARFKTIDGIDDAIDAIVDNAAGQFRDQGIAFAVLVVGLVLQNWSS
jgi:hypothetical protein